MLTHTGQVNCSDDISDERAALTFAGLAGFSALVFTGAAASSVSVSESTLSLSEELSDRSLLNDPKEDSDPKLDSDPDDDSASKLDSDVSEAGSSEDDSASQGNCAKTNVNAAAQLSIKRLLVTVFLSMTLPFQLRDVK